MKAKILPEGISLIAERGSDRAELDALYKAGHIHLCCKAIGKAGKKTQTLLLTPSFIRWTQARQKK